MTHDFPASIAAAKVLAVANGRTEEWGEYVITTAYELGEPDPGYLAWLEANGVPFDAEQPIKIVVRS
jgi:hypothetical protein